MRECHSFNHILESDEMNEREGRMRLILNKDKDKNDDDIPKKDSVDMNGLEVFDEMRMKGKGR